MEVGVGFFFFKQETAYEVMSGDLEFRRVLFRSVFVYSVKKPSLAHLKDRV